MRLCALLLRVSLSLSHSRVLHIIPSLPTQFSYLSRGNTGNSGGTGGIDVVEGRRLLPAVQAGSFAPSSAASSAVDIPALADALVESLAPRARDSGVELVVSVEPRLAWTAATAAAAGGGGGAGFHLLCAGAEPSGLKVALENLVENVRRRRNNERAPRPPRPTDPL